MSNTIELLIKKIKERRNPSIIADDITSYIIASLREKQINLYEAYMINMETIRFDRLAYTQPAWERKVVIRTFLSILNQKFLANVFDEKICANKLREWGMEAYGLYVLKRKHYIMDRYFEFLDADNSPEILLELQNIRNNNENLNFDNGPYHIEVFPYLYYSPEGILLNEAEKRKHCSNKTINEDVVNLIIELNLLSI